MTIEDTPQSKQMTTNTQTDELSEEQLLKLPEELIDRIDNRISRTTFETREEYVTEALDQLLTQVETDSEVSILQPEESAAETEAVKDQLESLGYL